jgi:WD40 repeat protein
MSMCDRVSVIGIAGILLIACGALNCSAADGAAHPPQRMDSLGDPLPARALARFGTTRLRQADFFDAVAFSPDGKTLFAKTYHGVVSMWDTTTGRLIGVLHRNDVNVSRDATNQPDPWSPLLASRDGRQLIAIGYGKVFLWDLSSRSRRFLPDLGASRTAALSPDDSVLASGAGLVSVIDLSEGKRRFNLNIERMGTASVAFSPDGKLLAAGQVNNGQARDTAILLWDSHTGRSRGRLQGHQKTIEGLAFSPDGKTLASGSWDGTIRLWAPATQKQIREIGRQASRLAYSSDGKLLASSGPDDTVSLWDPSTGRLVREIAGGAGGVAAIAFSPDGKTLATASHAYALHLWDVATGKEVRSFAAHQCEVKCVRFSPDGKSLASASSDQTVRVWDWATTKQRYCLAAGDPRFVGPDRDGQFVRVVGGLGFSPDGRLLTARDARPNVVGQANPVVYVWDLGSGELRLTVHEARWTPSTVAFAPDGSVLAAAVAGGVRLWSPTSGRAEALLPAPMRSDARRPVPEGDNCLAFSPDGETLAVGTYVKTIRLWNWRTRTEVRVFLCPQWDAAQLVFSPDGAILASCAGKHPGRADPNISLWEPATGTLIRSIKAFADGVNSIAISPDGRLIAGAGEASKTVGVWNLITGEKVAEFTGHAGAVVSVDFSPDGKTLASGSTDTTVLLWDLEGIEARLPPADTTPEAIAKHWDALAATDASRAYPSLWALVAAADKALPLLRQHLHSVSAPDAKRLQEWLADLDSTEFDTRETAERELKRLGKPAEPAVRQALAKSPSAEARRRLEAILEDIAGQPAGDDLRQLRAVRVLEHIGSPPARALLQTLAEGAPGAALTRAARLAVQRLDRRKAG